MKPVAADEVLRRYRAHRSRKIKVGRCVLSERSRRHRTDHKFSLEILRHREIEAVILHRHGAIIPDPAGTDDRDSCGAYVRAAAMSLVPDLRAWCRRWAPWLPASEVREIEALTSTRRRMIRADAVAMLLHVSAAERGDLGLKTIRASDVSSAELAERARDKKQERDRVRQERKRRDAGRKDRASYVGDSLSQKKPWEAEGISRRTWERRRVASLSRIEVNTTNGDTLASTTAAVSIQSESDGRNAHGAQGLGAKPPAGFQGAGPHGTGDTRRKAA